MRANEFLTEDTKKIKAFSPWDHQWTFYKRPTGELPDELDLNRYFGVAEIKGKKVIWSLFGFGLKYGEFYTIDDYPIEKYAKPDNFTVDDVKAAWLYKAWDRAKPEKRKQLMPEFLSLKISPQFKKIPKVLYRGMQLPLEAQKQLQQGQSFKMHNQIATSWTTERENTAPFIGRKKQGGGIIISKSFTNSDVIVNLQSLEEKFQMLQSDRWMDENEVLIKGNGIGPVLNKKKVKIEYSSWEDFK